MRYFPFWSEWVFSVLKLSSCLLTCGHQSGRHPALAVLNRIPVAVALHVMLKDRSTSGPWWRILASSVISIRTDFHESTISIYGTDLEQNISVSVIWGPSIDKERNSKPWLYTFGAKIVPLALTEHFDKFNAHDVKGWTVKMPGMAHSNEIFPAGCHSSIETDLFTIFAPQVAMNFYSWEIGLGHFLNKTKNVYFNWTHYIYSWESSKQKM